MKRFSLFLTEAATSQASTQAKKLNLKSDGHGSWFDSRGTLVAVTEKGRLKFTNKKQPKAQEGPVKQMATARADDKLAGAPLQKPAPKARAKAAEPEGDAKSGGGETLTTAFGRFNPPTIGHEKLLQAAKKAAAGGALKIYPSRTQDNKKNPLDPDMKVSYMRKMFPDFEEEIINDPDMRSIFDVLIAAAEEGYSNINIVVGADRQAEFDNLAQKYNGDLYDFELINVISAGIRDDSEGVEGMSASKLRKAVADDDFDAFKRGLPKGIDDGDRMALYHAVRQGMKIKKGSKISAKEKSAARYQEDEKGRKAAEKKRLPQWLDTAVDDAIKKHGTVSKHDKGGETEVEKVLKKGAKKKKKTTKESVDLWQIAPRLDQQTLREKYVTKQIFNIGDLVENLNTGLVGRIMRRGTNYLICVTEQNNMFKSWIRDVMEAVVNYSGPSGVPASQREVGTNNLRQYAMDLTGTKKIRNFINKYRKNKK